MDCNSVVIERTRLLLTRSRGIKRSLDDAILILSRNMGNWYRTRCICVILVGLLAFAQMAQLFSICRGTDGNLHMGLGCQCPVCAVTLEQPQNDSCCGCDDAACGTGLVTDCRTQAALSASPCCTGVILPMQHAAVLNQGLRPAQAPQQIVQAVIAVNSWRSSVAPAYALRLLSQPPGFMRPAVLPNVVLRV
jgi:hypothetical protein